MKRPALRGLAAAILIVAVSTHAHAAYVRGEPIPQGIAESRMLLNGYRAGLDDRETGLAYTHRRAGGLP